MVHVLPRDNKDYEYTERPGVFLLIVYLVLTYA